METWCQEGFAAPIKEPHCLHVPKAASHTFPHPLPLPSSCLEEEDVVQA